MNEQEKTKTVSPVLQPFVCLIQDYYLNKSVKYPNNQRSRMAIQACHSL